MESDLPPIQIDEEDDSLLPQLQDLDQTPSKSSLDNFNLSPFALPPSHAKNLRDRLCMEKPCSSSSEATNNKENVNLNSVEVPKMGIEPMQMKRRKKGGGYNLRKSLAWDRAFFTDEGILDPLELTLITGIDANTCGGGLPTIREVGNSSYYTGVRDTHESNDMEASQEAKLKDPRDNNHTTKGNSDNTGCSLRTYDSLLHYKVTHNVLSSNHTNRNRLKVGGSSEPSPASSLKRPASSNDLKTVKKEYKLPKLPISKPGSCSYALTKGSMAVSQLRHNLIPKPTKGVEKNFGLKSSLQNVHGSQSKAKTDSGNLHLPVKEPAQKTVKNLTHSLKATSLTRSRLVDVDRANSGSETVPNTSHARPTGLRLPSPSLDLFDQRTTNRYSYLRPKKTQQEQARLPAKIDEATENICSAVLTSSKECCTPSSQLNTSTKRVPHSNVYQILVTAIQHQEENISTGVDDLAHTSWEETDTVKSDDVHPKVNQESHLDAGSQVFLESQGQDVFRKSENDDGTTKFVASGIEEGTAPYNSALQLSGSHIMPAENSCLEEGMLPNATGDHLSQEKRVANAIHIEVEAQKQDGVDVDLIPGEVAPLIYDQCDQVEYISETASSGDEALVKRELVLQGAQCTSTYPQSLEEEKLDTAAPTVEAKPTVQGFTCGVGSCSQFQSENQTLKGSGSISNIFKTNVEDAHNHSIENSDHSDVYGKPVQVSNNGIILEQDSKTNHEHFQQESVCKVVWNDAEENQNDVYECDPAPSNTSVVDATPPVVEEVGSRTSSSIVLEASVEPNGCFTNELSDSKTTLMIEEQVDLPPTVGEFQHELDDHKNATMSNKKSNSIKKQDNTLVIHPPNVVPFSDEWLAAFEAAGEEILSMKCGAVQHSPPDKSLPQPGPWSPVKKKANQIGPYDCTKYTNGMSSSSQLTEQ